MLDLLSFNLHDVVSPIFVHRLSFIDITLLNNTTIGPNRTVRYRNSEYVLMNLALGSVDKHYLSVHMLHRIRISRSDTAYPGCPWPGYGFEMWWLIRIHSADGKRQILCHSPWYVDMPSASLHITARRPWCDRHRGVQALHILRVLKTRHAFGK